MLFWNAGIMGRKEQLLEAIFGSMRSSKEVTATSRRHHVATSPSHDVGSTNAEVNNSATSPSHDVGSTNAEVNNLATSPRRHVATSPRRDVSSKICISSLNARGLEEEGIERRTARGTDFKSQKIQTLGVFPGFVPFSVFVRYC